MNTKEAPARVFSRRELLSKTPRLVGALFLVNGTVGIVSKAKAALDINTHYPAPDEEDLQAARRVQSNISDRVQRIIEGQEPPGLTDKQSEEIERAYKVLYQQDLRQYQIDTRTPDDQKVFDMLKIAVGAYIGWVSSLIEGELSGKRR